MSSATSWPQPGCEPATNRAEPNSLDTMHRPTPDPLVADLATGLMSRLEPLADELTDRIATEIDVYQDGGVVSRGALRSSIQHNLTYMLGQLVRAEEPDLSAPSATGRTRAEQGAPLPEVLRAYRFGFAFLWDQLLAAARASGQDALDALLDTASHIWELADIYSIALTDSYRLTVSERMVAADRRRSTLVAALVEGSMVEGDTVWELAKLLDFPYDGSFLVVVAETTSVGAEALPGFEDRLRTLDVASAWRHRPDREVGLLSCGRRRPVADVLEAVRAVAVARVGISPEYTRLDETPRAMRFAQIALDGLPPGKSATRQLSDTPLGELVTGNLDTTRRVVQRILGDVATLPDDDRAMLLSTAEAWLDARGSAAEAGRQLYCHENTVRYRLHRLEEHLGRTLDDPRAVADLATALQAIATFPELGTRATDAT